MLSGCQIESPSRTGGTAGKAVWFASSIESDSLQWGNKPNSAAGHEQAAELWGLHSVRTALVFVVKFAAVRCPCDTVLGIRIDAGHSGRAVDLAVLAPVPRPRLTAYFSLDLLQDVSHRLLPAPTAKASASEGAPGALTRTRRRPAFDG